MYIFEIIFIILYHVFSITKPKHDSLKQQVFIISLCSVDWLGDSLGLSWFEFGWMVEDGQRPSELGILE